MKINMATSRTASNDEESATQEVVAPAGKRKSSRKRNIIIFTVVSILNVALLALLWTVLLTPAYPTQTSSGGGGSGFGDASGLGDSDSPLLGKPMPDFTLSTLDGKSNVRLANFKGQPIILNFWASWCIGCKQEAPFLRKIQTPLKAQGVQLIGVDGQEPASAGQQFARQQGLGYLNVHDTLNGNTAISYGVTGFPETVFINRSGIVVAKWIGVLTEKGLQLELAKMKL